MKLGALSNFITSNVELQKSLQSTATKLGALLNLITSKAKLQKALQSSTTALGAPLNLLLYQPASREAFGSARLLTWYLKPLEKTGKNKMKSNIGL